jgi:organic hydroperoxide reductase OsmC/OhrA
MSGDTGKTGSDQGKEATGQADAGEVEETLTVSMERLEGFRFQVDFGEELPGLLLDEPEPLGEGTGPNATRALSAAVGNCLSASLLFCLRKSRVDVESLHTDVTTTLTRNERGRLRVGKTRVTIQADFDADQGKKMDRCLGMFEDFCVVTAAVRDGIEVEVAVLDGEGSEIHRATETTPAGGAGGEG